jgi:hypothetical protein
MAVRGTTPAERVPAAASRSHPFNQPARFPPTQTTPGTLPHGAVRCVAALRESTTSVRSLFKPGST